MKRIACLLLAPGVALLSGCAGSLTGPLPAGTWGGEGVLMEVQGDGARLEFDCAGGEVPARVVLDDGAFEAAGTFTLEHGGPVREGETPDVREALYSGTLRDGQLSLLISVSGIAEPVGPFTLRRGADPLLRKCL